MISEHRIFNPSPPPRDQRLGPRQGVKPPPVGQWVAWGIAKDAANSEAIGKAYAPLAPSAEDRAASRDQINALMNAAAALQGIAARDWAEGMIRECAAEAE